MDFTEYIELIAKKLKTADKDEYLRLCILLLETTQDTIKRIQS